MRDLHAARIAAVHTGGGVVRNLSVPLGVDDLLVALVFLGTKADHALVTTRLAELVGSRGQDWHVLTTGAFVTILMPLVVFFSLQRYFVRGLMAGSVKG